MRVRAQSSASAHTVTFGEGVSDGKQKRPSESAGASTNIRLRCP